MSQAPPSIEPSLRVLRSSAKKLQALVADLSDADIEGRAYPSEWSVADVMSHLGSGAEIMQRRLDDALSGKATPDEFASSVWDAWNAKTPRSKVADALAVDRALIDRLEALSPDEQSRFRYLLGPMEFDVVGFIGLRLNEHIMHTWDIAVVGDRSAALPAEAADFVVDNLGLIAHFTAKPTGRARTITVATSAPTRHFTVTLAADSANLVEGDGQRPADLELPAEAFARLVYGRLDPFHTPIVTGDAGALDELRRVFPGP